MMINKQSQRIMRLSFSISDLRTRKLSLCAQILLCFIALIASVLGCPWPRTDHSVRFNGYRNESEFGRLPPLPRYLSDGKTWPLSYSEEEEEYRREKEILTQIAVSLNEAAAAQQRGDIVTARKFLRSYLEGTDFVIHSGWMNRSEAQKHRNAAIDKLDALTALDQGSPSSAVKSYLDARMAYDLGGTSEEILLLLTDAQSDKNLADNALYLKAAIFYKQSLETAQQTFNRLAAWFPKSEKREAALYMAGVAAMKQSKSYENAIKHGSGAPLCDNCRDDKWREARRNFERVMSEYPRGRYRSDARGWLAYLSLGIGDRAGSLVEYYRLLSIENDQSAKIEALTSLKLLRRRADESVMKLVENQIEDEPNVALAYAYHNIYNYAVERLNDWETNEDARQREHRAELERIAAFSTRLIRRYPNMSIEGGFSLRLAEANLELSHHAEAANLARRALSSGLKGDKRAQALWVEGVAEHRLRRYQPARQALIRLIAEFPNGWLNEGARRYLAMVAEDMGDLNGALEQYLTLGYSADVAYFVDVLMTPEQLSVFIDSHPDISHRDEFLYGLGVRYLRVGRWNDARQAFSRVKTVGREVDSDLLQRGYQSSEEYKPTPKEPWFVDDKIRGVRPRWIERDLQTADDLERMEKEFDLAGSDEAKAEALYQLASYQYQGVLLFYNPAAWGGGRNFNLNFLFYRRPNEAYLLFKHMQEHDRAARALNAYLEVVRRFPNTRAARDALYTAAVCHERLSDYNDYWRSIYSEGGHAGSRHVTYKDVKTAYPDYQLPRGTYGWEPATRTVNGGPGWAAPPKPKPRPTRRERLLQLLSVMAVEVTKAWHALTAWLVRLYECLWVGFAFSGLLFLWRCASQARKVLIADLARCQSRPVSENDKAKNREGVGLMTSKLDRHPSLEKRDEWRNVALNAIYKLKQLWRDQQGRSILLLNAAAHGMFAALLMMLL